MGGSGVARAIENIVLDLREELQYAPEFFRDVAKRIVLPTIGIVIAIAAFLRLTVAIRRVLFPPDAEQLHKEALGELKKRSDPASRKEAKRLLKKSIKRDPGYLPSYLSLAAIQIYEEEAPDEGIETIDRALTKFPKNKELLQMRLDAQAMKQNLGHMVQVGGFASMYLGDLGWMPKD